MLTEDDMHGNIRIFKDCHDPSSAKFAGEECYQIAYYHDFTKFVEYIFSPEGLSMMTRTILRLWLAALTKGDVML